MGPDLHKLPSKRGYLNAPELVRSLLGQAVTSMVTAAALAAVHGCDGHVARSAPDPTTGAFLSWVIAQLLTQVYHLLRGEPTAK